MDTVFIGGNIELGCMEIWGRTEDYTKEMQDGSFPSPLVMKDMLVDITNKTPSLIHDAGITGFCIHYPRLSGVTPHQLPSNASERRIWRERISTEA